VEVWMAIRYPVGGLPLKFSVGFVLRTCCKCFASMRWIHWQTEGQPCRLAWVALILSSWENENVVLLYACPASYARSHLPLCHAMETVIAALYLYMRSCSASRHGNPLITRTCRLIGCSRPTSMITGPILQAPIRSFPCIVWRDAHSTLGTCPASCKMLRILNPERISYLLV